MTHKENMLRIYNHQAPQWIPLFFESAAMLSSSIVNNQGVPGKGGPDWFGVNWLVRDESGFGAIHDPHQHLVEDITKWRDIIKFPDLEQYDWERVAQQDLARVDRSEKLTVSNMMDGNFNRLESLMGTCEALMAFLEEPEAVLDFFEENTKFRIKLIEKYAKYYNLDVMINGDDVCSSDGLMFSRTIYDTFIKPFEKRLAEAAIDHGMIVEHHVCGKCEAIIPDIIETGATSIEPMQPGMNDLRKMKELYGDKLAFVGGWDVYGPQNDIDASEELVRQSVRDVILQYGYDGQLIVYGGGLMPTSTPAEIRNQHMFWMSDECRTFSEKYIRENLL